MTAHRIHEAAEAREAKLYEKIGELEAALEFIAEAYDAGRHDGLPEPCPAHDAETMFAVANAALKGEQDDG